MTQYQSIRYIADFIEPFIMKYIRKKFHTLYVYRCSDFQDLQHLCSCHKFDIHDIPIAANVINKFWTSTDLIRLEIQGMPNYARTKDYFDRLRVLEINDKKVIDITPYEVKLHSGTIAPMLSVNTFNMMRELRKIGKDLEFVMVCYKGHVQLQIDFEKFEDTKYNIETHYGGKGYRIRPRFE